MWVVCPSILSRVQFWIISMIFAVIIFAPRARFILRAVANFLNGPFPAVFVFVAFVVRAASASAQKSDEQKK